MVNMKLNTTLWKVESRESLLHKLLNSTSSLLLSEQLPKR
jgi:hypothetical protein